MARNVVILTAAGLMALTLGACGGGADTPEEAAVSPPASAGEPTRKQATQSPRPSPKQFPATELCASGGLSTRHATVRALQESRTVLAPPSLDKVKGEITHADADGLEGLRRLICLQALELPETRRRKEWRESSTPYRIAHPFDLSALEALVNLELLDLTARNVLDLTPLSGMKRMRVLRLQATIVEDLTPLEGMERLEALNLAGTRVVDLTPIASLPRLRWLTIDSEKLEDASPLRQLGSLTDLTLVAPRVRDVSFLAEMRLLLNLDLRGTGLEDVSFATGLDRLQRIDISGSRVSDLTPLHGMTWLLYATAVDVPVTAEDCVALEQALPETAVACRPG